MFEIQPQICTGVDQFGGLRAFDQAIGLSAFGSVSQEDGLCSLNHLFAR